MTRIVDKRLVFNRQSGGVSGRLVGGLVFVMCSVHIKRWFMVNGIDEMWCFEVFAQS